ncbi:MAG: tRNA (guanosine(46)-N7)-methyltransferase TrmB [Bacteroidota bacterium]
MARKKQIRNQEYLELENCFTREDKHAGKWREVFRNDCPITLELGCGKAEFSLELARRYPTQNFVGIDLKPDRMWHAASQALEEGIENIKFLWINLTSVGDYFSPGEIAHIWITFPDPYPKNRQAKHRMINPAFLHQYKQIMQEKGSVFFKTDSLELFHYSLEVFVDQADVVITELSFDLHEAEKIHDDARIKTSYEKIFLRMGKKINYLRLAFLP